MTSTVTSTRFGVQPGLWIGDPIHSAVCFRVRHMGIGKVRGSFTLSSATLDVRAGGLADSRVTAVVDATSVNTGEAPRDRHLRSEEFLDVATYPTLTFLSTEVRDLSGDSFKLVGELTLHGVTRVVEFAVDHLGVVEDPSGAQRTGFSATTTLSRAAFGIDIELAFGAGNVVVGDTVEIELDVEFLTDEGHRA